MPTLLYWPERFAEELLDSFSLLDVTRFIVIIMIYFPDMTRKCELWSYAERRVKLSKAFQKPYRFSSKRYIVADYLFQHYVYGLNAIAHIRRSLILYYWISLTQVWCLNGTFVEMSGCVIIARDQCLKRRVCARLHFRRIWEAVADVETVLTFSLFHSWKIQIAFTTKVLDVLPWVSRKNCRFCKRKSLAKSLV